MAVFRFVAILCLRVNTVRQTLLMAVMVFVRVYWERPKSLELSLRS